MLRHCQRRETDHRLAEVDVLLERNGVALPVVHTRREKQRLPSLDVDKKWFSFKIKVFNILYAPLQNQLFK